MTDVNATAGGTAPLPGPRAGPCSFPAIQTVAHPANPPRPRCLALPEPETSGCRSSLSPQIAPGTITHSPLARANAFPSSDGKSLPCWDFRHVGRFSGRARGRLPGQTALSATRGAVSRAGRGRFRPESGGPREEPGTTGGPWALTPAGRGCQARPRKGAGGLMPIAARSPFAAAPLARAAVPVQSVLARRGEFGFFKSPPAAGTLLDGSEGGRRTCRPPSALAARGLACRSPRSGPACGTARPVRAMATCP